MCVCVYCISCVMIINTNTRIDALNSVVVAVVGDGSGSGDIIYGVYYCGNGSNGVHCFPPNDIYIYQYIFVILQYY